MNFFLTIFLIVSHMFFFYMGYNFGKRVHKWEINQKNENFLKKKLH